MVWAQIEVGLLKPISRGTIQVVLPFLGIALSPGHTTSNAHTVCSIFLKIFNANNFESKLGCYFKSMLLLKYK